MSTLVVYSDTTDGHIYSVDGVADDGEGGGTPGTWAGAKAGTGIFGWSDTYINMSVGQHKYTALFTEWAIAESFLAFNTSSIPDGDIVSAAVLNLTSYADNTTTDFTIEARLYDWGAAVTTADWVIAGLSALTLLAHHDTASGWTVNTAYDLTDDAFAANVNKTGSTRLLLCSDHTTTDTAPTQYEELALYSADQAGTTKDPKLTVTYAQGEVYDGPGPTLDAVISKTAAGSFTANAVLRVARAGSFTADVAVKRNQTGSFTADAAIKKTLSGSFAADALLRVGRTGSATADAIVKRTQTPTFTADAAIFRTQTGSATIDAVIMPTFRADAVVRRTQTGSATADAVIMPRFRADAITRVTQSGTFSANAWLFGTTVFGFAANAVIKKTQTPSLTADAVLLVARAGSFTGNAAIKKTASGSFTANAVVKAAVSSSVKADAIQLRTFWFGSVEAGF